MSPKKSKFHALKEFYQLYTSGLSRSEIERLLKRESLDVLSYYRKGAAPKNSTEDKFPGRQLLVVKDEKGRCMLAILDSHDIALFDL